MVKKTYRRFSKKGLSKKNKLRKSKRKSLRSKRKSRKHGGDEGSSSGPTITRGKYWGHESCGTDRGTIKDIKCQSEKVKAYNESKRLSDFGQLSEHKDKLADSIKTYIEKKYKPIAITSDEIEPIIPNLQKIDNLNENKFNEIISTIQTVRDKLNEINDDGYY